jgi:hypothetical protein
MRASLSFFLAIMLSLNAAYMASVGVCVALEHSTNHAEHFGHHQHHHSDDHDHDDQIANADEADNTTSVSDHHHNHAHPGFSTILPDSIGIVPLIDDSIAVANLTEIFVSAPISLIERPPRKTLA